MNYQDLFQCLKGVGTLDLSSFVLPINNTGYVLKPINCRARDIDTDIIDMLVNARNANANSFLTFFTATPEKTKNWLVGPVAYDSTRILFALKEMQSKSLYGYMGLAYGTPNGKRIEGDAIVRYKEQTKPGLMRLAFLQLVEWARNSIGIDEIWVRVLSDNPAIDFYKRCNFVIVFEVPLYEARRLSGELEELSELRNEKKLSLSKRKLTYMKYLPSN